ncbi:MAG: RDD family protein [Candidatus Dadabacteria bacterium]|nr:RDD family protein [Candidatus Dadabacteria bacterium]
MSAQVWFYEKDKKPSGPVSEEELWDLLNAGEITKDSLVWKEPMEKWLPFSEVQELRIPPRPKPPPMPEPEEVSVSEDPSFKTPSAPEDKEKEETYEHVEKVVFKTPEYQGGETTTIDAEYEEVDQVRPWVRFLARMTDYYIFSMLVSILISLLFPDFMEQMSEMITQQISVQDSEAAGVQSILFVVIVRIVVTFIWVFIEAYTISKYGTTFGKNLLGTRVLDKDGELLPYDRSLKRSYGVWLKGMGAGFILISWVTMLFGYQMLKRDGVNSWDKDADSKIVHSYFSTRRLFIILGFIFVIEIFALRSVI